MLCHTYDYQQAEPATHTDIAVQPIGPSLDIVLLNQVSLTPVEILIHPTLLKVADSLYALRYIVL